MNILNYVDFINEELDFNIVKCEFTNKTINYIGHIIDCYTFITKLKNSYTVYIHETIESNHLLDSGLYLQNINNSNKIIVPTIYFSETSNGLNSSKFNRLTNNGEFMEVMGKVLFIINYYINNNLQYNIFSIGGVDTKKENFYKKWVNNLNISRIDSGISDNYLDHNGNKIKSYYLIR